MVSHNPTLTTHYLLYKRLIFNLILIDVDDLIIFGNDHGAIQKFKGYLSDCFHMKDLGVLKYFLGVEVARNPEGIFLCQASMPWMLFLKLDY